MVVEDRLGRREFLSAAAGLAAGVVGKFLFDRYTPVFAAGTDERVLLAGTEPSPLLVTRGVNLRTEPQIPPRSRFYQRSNVVSWEDIVSINRVPLENKDAFVVLDTVLAYGQETNSNRWGTNRWGIIRVAQRSKSEETVVYFNIGSDYVRSLIDYYHAGKVLPPRIIVPTNKETAAREILPPIWAQDIRDKFNGVLPLATGDYGEVIYNNVAVVPAGVSEADRNQNANVPVNVRNFPEVRYSNGEPINVYGTVSMGTNINNVLLTRSGSWGAFKFPDLQGELKEPNGRTINLDSNAICAINSDYILTTDHST